MDRYFDAKKKGTLMINSFSIMKDIWTMQKTAKKMEKEFPGLTKNDPIQNAYGNRMDMAK